MRNLTQLLTAAALLGFAAGITFNSTAAPPPSKSMQTAKQFQFEKTERVSLQYLLFLPKGYDAKADKKWPLMLFLHGAGERGTNVWKVATHGPPKHVTNHPDFPFIIVSPQCAEGQVWDNDALLALLDDITATHAVDTTRVYLTGLSMGGYGTWSLGLSYPERFAAIVPICGGGEWVRAMLSSREKAQALQSLGIWAFHGAKDPVVPLAESQRMVDIVKRLGVKEVKLTVYPEAQHNCWTETYDNPELYQWFLQHERKPVR
jgi:predicted peptidase